MKNGNVNELRNASENPGKSYLFFLTVKNLFVFVK